jgi:fibronectin-binding autotransporter adhesin
MTAGLLTMTGIAQTSANGSDSGNASVNPGQASAGASTSQSAQTPGASANVDGSGSANAKASHNGNKQNEKDKGAAAGASGNGAGAAGVGGASGALSSGTSLQAELTKSLDAKKAKPGDEVSAKLTQDVKENGKVVLHKGSKLVGHVTEAQVKSKENAESKLGVVFDKAVLKGGQEMAFNGVIQAVAPPVQGALSVAGDENSSLGSGMGSGSSMGGGHSSGGGIAPIGAATSAAGGTVGAVGNTAGSVSNTAGSVTNSTGAVNGAVNRTAGVAANGALNSAAHGVVGMQGVDLNTAAAGSAQGSVISSASRNIKLDSGTQMVLQVTGSAAAH